MTLSFQTANSQVAQEWFAGYTGPGNGKAEATSIVADDRGFIYVTGWSIGSGTGADYTTIKYNSSGSQQWAARYNGTGNSVDEASDIAVDAAGNVYVTGRSRATNSEYTYDYVTIKYNPSGVEQWSVRYNGPAGGSDEAYSLVLDKSGNVYVTGQAGHSALNGNYATIKYNPEGVQQWVATYDGPAGDWDRALSIAVDDLQNVYVTGSHSIMPGTAFHDYATIKYDAAGVQQWIRTYNGTGNNWDEGISVGLDASGNIYVTGFSSGTVYDFVTIKYDPSGIEQWTKVFSSGGNSVDVPTSMIVDKTGNVYITGASSFDFGTIKYNSLGDQEWFKTYDTSGNFDAANSIAVDIDGNVFVTGVSSSGFLESTKDYATIKYNSTGDQQWIQSHNGTGNNWDESRAITVDDAGSVFITGYSSISGSTEFGTIKYSQPLVVLPVSTGIPGDFSLSQNYPNPFNPVTHLEFGISKLEFVSLKIFDATGKEVQTLVEDNLSPGVYKVEFNGYDLSSGVYFYKMTAGNFSEMKKMVLVK